MSKLTILLLLLLTGILNAQELQNDVKDRTELFFGAGTLASTPELESRPERISLPNAPEPLPVVSLNASSAFSAVYAPKQTSTPPLPVAGKFWNKKLVAAHAVLLASAVYDVELTHQGLAHHNCEEADSHFGTHPSRAELYQKSSLAFGAISGLDWLTTKTRVRYLPYIGPVAGTTVHLIDGSKWLAECW